LRGRLTRALPLLLAAALLIAVVGSWALGPPDYPLLTPQADRALPAMDIPCEGHLLEADPDLRDPHFAHRTVLLCVMGADGALGVVVDAASAVPARSVWMDAPLSMGLAHSGGPLGAGQGVLLYVSADGDLRFTTVALRAPFPSAGWARPPRATDVRWVGVGHAGWAAGQLEDEVEAGAWTLTDRRWQDALPPAR
jgi:putative transcriptional regulator